MIIIVLHSTLSLDTSDNSEGKMKTTTETGTRKTRLSEYIQSNFNLIKNSSTFGSDSSFSSNALQEGRQEGEIIASSHSASSLEEMDDSLCSLKQYNRFKHHSNCHTITGQPQKIIPKTPDTEQSPSFKMRRQSSLADNEQICNFIWPFHVISEIFQQLHLAEKFLNQQPHLLNSHQPSHKEKILSEMFFIKCREPHQL